MVDIIFRIGGPVLDYLRDEFMYARPYGEVIAKTWTDGKFEVVKYDRQEAIFRVKKDTGKPPRHRELLLLYSPLTGGLDPMKVNTKVELQYYSKHKGERAITHPSTTDNTPDLDRILNAMYFNDWDFTSTVKRFEMCGFKYYNSGMRFANLELEGRLVSKPDADEGTQGTVKVYVEKVNDIVKLDMRII